MAFTWMASMSFDLHHPPKQCCRPSKPPHHNSNIFATLQKLLRNDQRNKTKSSRNWPSLQIPHNPIQSSICGICRSKPKSTKAHLETHRTQRICHQYHRARHQDSLCHVPYYSRAVFYSVVGHIVLLGPAALPQGMLFPWEGVLGLQLSGWCLSGGIHMYQRFPQQFLVI